MVMITSAIRKYFFLFLCFCTVFSAAAAELDFSGTPAAGQTFLCRFTVKRTMMRKMEIKGAKEQPQQMLLDDYSLNGRLLIRENSSRGIIFQFVLDDFQWIEAGERKTAGTLVRAKIDIGLDAQGALKLCRIVPDGMILAQEVPPALQKAFIQLGRSLKSSAAGILGPNVSKQVGDHWKADQKLVDTIAANRRLKAYRLQDWDSKILFTGTETFLDIPVNRIDLNLFTSSIPGYDCRINMIYRFPIKNAASIGAVDYQLDWLECVDKIMPEDNPIFSGTKFVEVMQLNIQRSLIPLTD